MFNSKNTKVQGDIGLGDAIGWFTKNNHTVLIPLTDSQDYDLVVDYNGKLCKIQIKTTSYKNRKNFHVSLSVKGGNKSSSSIKQFDNTTVDYIYVLTSEGTRYLISSPNVKYGFNLGKKFDNCII